MLTSSRMWVTFAEALSAISQKAGDPYEELSRRIYRFTEFRTPAEKHWIDLSNDETVLIIDALQARGEDL